MFAKMIRSTAVRPTRHISLPRVPPFHTTHFRLASTTKSDVSGTNATHTSSASSAEGDAQSSRSLDSTPDEKGGSASSPVTNPSAGQGQDEEGGDPAKQDPNKSRSEKAEQTEKQGNKPLDPANK